jgi:hypothetical protein
MHDVGQKVKAKTQIIEHACGDHPEFLLARVGDELEITEVDAERERYTVVNHSLCPHAFTIYDTEIQ